MISWLGIVRSQEKLFLMRSSVAQAPGLLPDFQALDWIFVHWRLVGLIEPQSPLQAAIYS
jgi:hypothetical protein